MEKIKKLDALTSLRFFAAALIVIGHSHPLFGSCGLANAAPLGQGVSFFFVLSGFILSWNYPSLVGTKERINFWVARFARIWPLHAVTCLMWIAIVANFKPSGFGWDITCLLKLISNLLLVQAWIPLHDWALSYNGVSWSISAEFFFYALFPILVTFIQKSWHKVLFICGAYVLGLIIYHECPVVTRTNSIG
jgi:peptidoglycan/LPS O-acetylase OafA/YrhL